MARKLMTIILAIAMVFTMSVPAFAGEAEEAKKPGGVKYLAIGDSIGAGVKETTDTYRDHFDFRIWQEVKGQDAIDKIENKAAREYYTQFYNFYTFKDGIKNGNVYAVDFSFISRVANAIKADEKKSYNGAYSGLRAKDICRILDIPEAEGDDYTKDVWPDMGNFAKLFDPQNAEQYKKGIANADVITVELGENDLSAFGSDLFSKANEAQWAQWAQDMLDGGLTKTDVQYFLWANFMWGAPDLDLDNLEQYLSLERPLVSDLAYKIFSNGLSFDGISFIDTGDIDIEKIRKDFGALSDAKSLDDVIKTLKAIEDDLLALEKIGVDITSLLKEIFSAAGDLIDNGQYYLESLMKYIQENKKPGAIVVVGTYINPIGTPDDEGNKVRKALDLVYYDVMNSFIKTNAGIYDYYVADLSDVSMNPKDNPDYNEYPVGNGDEAFPQTYNMHPNGEGQEKIAQRFLEQIQKVQRTEKVTKVIDTVATVAGVTALLVAPTVSDIKEKIADKITSDSKKKTTITETAKEETVVEQELVVTENVEDLAMTAEEVIGMISDATVRCATEKTEKGIKITAKVENADIDALKEEGYQVSYKFYRSTEKSSGYKCIFTSETGKFTNTSVKEGNKYYYKTVLVVTDSEGNEVTKSVLKDCKYGSRTF